MNALELLDDAIAELEARLNFKTLTSPSTTTRGVAPSTLNQVDTSKQQLPPPTTSATINTTNNNDSRDTELPDILKLEFKVGVITKVWKHGNADKLYCEEINVGENEPRSIASGLRPHFTEEQMLGQRCLVVSNLKAKNLVGFKSHGMVLCAAASTPGGGEKVEFVEPPPDATIGQVVTFEGLPPPQPLSAAQVEKKKIFQACMEGMKTSPERVAMWNGHTFMTDAGPCTVQSIQGGVLR